MARGLRKITRRKQSLDLLRRLFDDALNTLIIHYSCESFYKTDPTKSPRITSIAVRNLSTGQTTSFSISQLAERKKILDEDVDANYDSLEHEMLKDFYTFADRHSNFNWIHWNMRDTTFGFPALAHRFAVLGGKPSLFTDDRLIDLSRLLANIYGIAYISHPRFHKLREKNEISDQDLLDGEAEATAFAKKEYRKLHLSTLRKVDVLAGFALRADDGTLRTNECWRDRYGTIPEAIGELFKDSLWMRLLAIIGAAASIFGVYLAIK